MPKSSDTRSYQATKWIGRRQPSLVARERKNRAQRPPRKMHIPDGILTTPVWTTLSAISLPAVGWVARRAQTSRSTNGTTSSVPAPAALTSGIDDRDVPLMGVMGAFVFAAQMINFPVGLGTSGHLAGGTLLALVLGPAPAVIVMTAVLALQALIFQDGGILALGANILNIALVGVAAGIVPSVLLGRTRVAIFLGGTLSVATTATFALGELWMSGVAAPTELWVLSSGVFLVTGIMEGAITVAAAGAIDRLRPGRVIRAAVHQESLHLKPQSIWTRPTVAILAFAILLVTGGVLVASPDPDGLEKLALNLGLAESMPVWLWAPLAGYEFSGLGSGWLERASAGLIGVGLTLGVSVAAARALVSRRREARREELSS